MISINLFFENLRSSFLKFDMVKNKLLMVVFNL